MSVYFADDLHNLMDPNLWDFFRLFLFLVPTLCWYL